MSLFNKRVLSFAVVLVLVCSNLFAQMPTEVDEHEYGVPQLQEVSGYQSSAAYQLPWTPIAEKDVTWKKRVWRDIDVNDAQNKAFANDKSNPGNSNLVSILLEGIFSGKIKAYDPILQNWTKEYSKAELIALMSPGKGSDGWDLTQVSKYEIKEDWLFIKDKGQLVVRIAGLMPMRKVKGADGQITEQPMFLLYYPDIRNYLAQHKVLAGGQIYEGKNWDELFEGRSFVSTIVKVN